MKLYLFIWVFIIGLCLGPGVEAGAIYEWIDKDGTRHFTDGPPPPGAQLVEGLSDTQSGEPPPGAGASDDGNRDAAQGEEPGPNEVQGADAVEDGDKSPTSRDEVWRNRGWGNAPPNPAGTDTIEDGARGPSDSEKPGGVEDADKPPANPEDAAPAEDGEKEPGGSEDQWRSRGW